MHPTDQSADSINPSASIENRRSDDRYNDSDDDEAAPAKKLKFDAKLCDESNEELHRKLMEVDPVMARKLHPNNRRKVIR